MHCEHDKSKNHESFFIPGPQQPIIGGDLGEKTAEKNSDKTMSNYSTVNLSDLELTKWDLELLEKGLTFIPTRKILPVKNIVMDQNRLIRTLKLRSCFKHNIENKVKKKFCEPKNWTPPNSRLDTETLKLIDHIKIATADTISQFIKEGKCTINNDNRFEENSKTIKMSDKNNLKKEEIESLYKLKNNNEIVIKNSDKGGATVILNRANYIFEAERQLHNEKYYKKLSAPIYKENQPKILNILNNMLKDNFITKDQFHYLSGPKDIKTRVFYLLPKIHKAKTKWPQPDKMPEGRPIVSDVNSETYRVTEIIDHYLNPLASKHESYIKNTYDFINNIRDFAVKNNYLLVTGDVTALYTNMNIDRSLDTVKQIFSNNPDPARPDKYLLELLEISLKGNDFNFNNQWYLQIMGTAMGKRFAPALANLYLLNFDRAAMNDFKIKPLLFFRYLDDIFFLWPADIQSLLEYEIFLNSLIPDIKITLEYSKNEINFLDTTIYIYDNKLKTRVYFKPTDTHQLLHTNSFHPKHTFKGIVKSQMIRYKRISSYKCDFDKTCKILFSSLKRRGYKFSEMRRLKNDVWFNFQERCSNENKTNKDFLIPITMDFCNIGKELTTKFKTIIRQNSAETNLTVAFKNGKNLKQLLIKSQLPSKQEGAFRGCGESKCKLCLNHSTDTASFTSTTKKTVFKIQENMTCSSKSIVYLITCRKCYIQYVGETSKTLRERMTQHRSCIKNKKITPIAIHFNSPQHSFLDMRAIAIEQLQINEDRVRKIKEKEWQNRLGTLYPLGLNGLPMEN